MTTRDADIRWLYEGLTFVARQARELGSVLHPELSVVAHGLLTSIAADPDIRAADIAAAYGLDKSTVSRQLSTLEAVGLLDRCGERPGRRGQALQLTAAGRRALARADDTSRAHLATHLADWSDTDIEALAGLLDRFAETSRQARQSGLGRC